MTMKLFLANCYWGQNGKYQELYELLEDKIPFRGPVLKKNKNKKLESLRIAINAYYDLYNNGLMNQQSSFSKIFKISARLYKLRDGFANCLYQKIEPVMDEIIFQAAIEQGLVSVLK